MLPELRWAPARSCLPGAGPGLAAARRHCWPSTLLCSSAPSGPERLGCRGLLTGAGRLQALRALSSNGARTRNYPEQQFPGVSQDISWDGAQGMGANWGCAGAVSLPWPCPLGACGLMSSAVLPGGTVARKGPAEPGATGSPCGASGRDAAGDTAHPEQAPLRHARGAGGTRSSGSSTSPHVTLPPSERTKAAREAAVQTPLCRLAAVRMPAGPGVPVGGPVWQHHAGAAALPGRRFLRAAWKSLPNRFDPRLPEPLPPPAPAFNCSGCWEISRLNLSNSNFQPGDRVLPLSARLEAPSPSQSQHCQVPCTCSPSPAQLSHHPLPTGSFSPITAVTPAPSTPRCVPPMSPCQAQNIPAAAPWAGPGPGMPNCPGEMIWHPRSLSYRRLQARCQQPGLTCVCGRPWAFYERSGSQSYLYRGGQLRRGGIYGRAAL